MTTESGIATSIKFFVINIILKHSKLMYSEYQKTVDKVLNTNSLNFKTNKSYNAILEHVTYEQGGIYMSLIMKIISDEFKEITFEDINDYLLLNDKYGNPKKETFIYNDKQVICSPTSLRYVLHSFLILKHLKSEKASKIVEVGCGYGGLFLAINHFSKIQNIEIDKYYFIDLPEVCDLINKYLELHQTNINIPYSTYLAYNYGLDINDEGLFFISNYCFTEIEEMHRNNYIKHLLPKVLNGFITWQTIFNVPISTVNTIGKNIKSIVEESPQTASVTHKNYYVYF